MALWMVPGANPVSEHEVADMEAIAAIKESAAVELKEEGNKYVKKGKKHYRDAINCYTRAINQKALADPDTSVLFANRAHVNLLLGNNRWALEDAEEALKWCPKNVKAYYRAAKAAFSLGLFHEAASFCHRGLEMSTSNEELLNLLVLIDRKIKDDEVRKLEASKAVYAAKELISAIESRGLKLGKTLYQGPTGLKKPNLDRNNILHWPVLLLFAEVMSSDFIEDFCEADMFSIHLDLMYSDELLPLPWDKDYAYTRDSIELYYQANSGTPILRREILQYLLEGTAGSLVEISNEEEAEHSKMSDGRSNISTCAGSNKLIKVNEEKTLYDVLRQPDFIITGIPAFFVVSNRSCFYKEFRAGNWNPP